MPAINIFAAIFTCSPAHWPALFFQRNLHTTLWIPTTTTKLSQQQQQARAMVLPRRVGRSLLWPVSFWVTTWFLRCELCKNRQWPCPLFFNSCLPSFPSYMKESITTIVMSFIGIGVTIGGTLLDICVTLSGWRSVRPTEIMSVAHDK